MNLDSKQNQICRKRRRRPYPLLILWLIVGGVSLLLGSVPGLPAHAQSTRDTPIDIIRSAAEHGDAQSQYALGRAYEDGLGVQADVKEAIKWYGKAAEQHLSVAQYVLGNILLHGEGGVAPDYAQARKWLTTAAIAGIPAAQRDLAKMHEQGLGGEPDPIWAWVWYDFAANGGDGKANGLRDELSRRLDSSALTEAKRLAADMAARVAPPPKQNQPR